MKATRSTNGRYLLACLVLGVLALEPARAAEPSPTGDLAVPAEPLPQRHELVAHLLTFTPGVRIRLPSNVETSPYPVQPLVNGSHLLLGPGDYATLLCPNKLTLRIDRSEVLLAGLCAVRGGEVRAGSTREAHTLLDPSRARLFAVQGDTTVALVNPRGHDPAKPLLLQPRATRLLDGRPRFLWQDVDEPIEVELIFDTNTRITWTLTPDDIHCQRRPPSAATAQPALLCEWQWPQQELPLEPGRYTVQLRTKGKTSADWRESPNQTWLEIQPTDIATHHREELDHAAPPEASPATRNFLRAAQAAQHQLWSEAIEALETGLEIEQTAEALVSLGDLYLQTALPHLAEAAYAAALTAQGSDEAKEAARCGLGRLGVGKEKSEQSDRTRSYHESLDSWPHQ